MLGLKLRVLRTGANPLAPFLVDHGLSNLAPYTYDLFSLNVFQSFGNFSYQFRWCAQANIEPSTWFFVFSDWNSSRILRVLNY